MTEWNTIGRLKNKPIEEMTIDEFGKLRADYFLCGDLSDSALREIERLFDVHFGSTLRVWDECDEYDGCHPHTYECMEFADPASGIVYRLLDQLREYKRRLIKIEELAKNPLPKPV